MTSPGIWIAVGLLAINLAFIIGIPTVTLCRSERACAACYALREAGVNPSSTCPYCTDEQV